MGGDATLTPVWDHLDHPGPVSAEVQRQVGDSRGEHRHERSMEILGNQLWLAFADEQRVVQTLNQHKK